MRIADAALLALMAAFGAATPVAAQFQLPLPPRNDSFAPTMGHEDFPGWARRPNSADVTRYAPPGLAEKGLVGDATVFCTIDARRMLKACKILRETPSGMGVGDAALRMTVLFKVKNSKTDAATVAGRTVGFPVRFGSATQ